MFIKEIRVELQASSLRSGAINYFQAIATIIHSLAGCGNIYIVGVTDMGISKHGTILI